MLRFISLGMPFSGARFILRMWIHIYFKTQRKQAPKWSAEGDHGSSSRLVGGKPQYYHLTLKIVKRKYSEYEQTWTSVLGLKICKTMVVPELLLTLTTLNNGCSLFWNNSMLSYLCLLQLKANLIVTFKIQTFILTACIKKTVSWNQRGRQRIRDS